MMLLLPSVLHSLLASPKTKGVDQFHKRIVYIINGNVKTIISAL